MSLLRHPRRSTARVLVGVTGAALLGSLIVPALAVEPFDPRSRPRPVAGANAGTAGLKTFASQEATAREAPYGSVAPGEYAEALASLRGLPGTENRWREVTDVPYDADDPAYRDPFYSNSGGGWGYVAGRVTGLAAGNGVVFAAGANGGVFRKAVGTEDWRPISDAILANSSGDLLYDTSADALWYATGEANTGATSYTGAGVYLLPKASRSKGGFTDADRVGGSELESRSINQLKLDGNGLVYAATTRGLYRHSTDPNRRAEPWELVLLPNPASDGDITKPYDNIVNDVVIQPGSRGTVVLANAAWRSGAAYNGFYLSTAGGAPGSFVRTPLAGDVNDADVGNAEFASAADGSRTYMVLESPAGLAAGTGSLGGIFVTTTGQVTGPWTLIADSAELEASGSAIGVDQGYPVGIQTWYNNFVEVDPADPEHVYVGLEEVFESTDAGGTWSTPGPYWNFTFPCFDPSLPTGGCPQTTHPDQHSVWIDGGTLWVGNDGGVYSRPVDPAASTEDELGHATDWTNHNVGLRTLQYYSVGVGRDPATVKGWAVAGGLQDNGGSLLRADATEQVSPFGGDGGDIIVNPRNGCEILNEYVFLALWLTKNCGQSDGTTNAIFDITVPDVNARFTAPFRVVRGSANVRDGASERWVAGGNSVWTHDYGFSYTPEEAAADDEEDNANGWRGLYALDETGARLVVGLDAVADPAAPTDASKDVVYAAWCGEVNCNSAGFTRGVATNWGGTWTELDLTGLPNRFPNNVAIDPDDPTGSTVYLVFNGFNRRFIEGPGAGTKHVYRGQLSKAADGSVQVAWTDLSLGFPDVPATDVVVVGDRLVVSTDLGVLLAPDKDAAADAVTWLRVGSPPGVRPTSLPLTAVYDLHVGADDNLYAATHGRGIWKTRLDRLP